MSHRENLLARLEAYEPYDGNEVRNVILTADIVRRLPEAFMRLHIHTGHVVAGYLVTNPSRTRVLLHRHGLGGMWLNFGGHADGDEDIDHVARKELGEEAGITKYESSGEIFDIDVHAVAPHVRRGEQVPWHLHYSINFLAIVPDDAPFAISDESLDVRWLDLDEATNLAAQAPELTECLTRMYAKVKQGLG